MFKIIALIVVIVLVIPVGSALLLAAAKPDQFRVERSTHIKASPDEIFPLINDYRRWRSWSPYENLDPEMKRTYSGENEGQGAVYEWQGNNKIGQGRMEIIESTPPSKITMKLDMIKPMEGHNIVTYTLEPEGDSTKVTWAMEGSSNFVSKIFQVFVSMDGICGSQFEEGLANLKSVVEE